MNELNKNREIFIDESYEVIEEPRINSNKILKLAGAATLSLALVIGTGFAIYDSSINHIEEICPIAQMASIPVPNEDGLTFGYIHQMKEMEKEYQAQGYNVSVSFSDEHKEFATERVVIDAMKQTLENGQIVYSAPDGYILEDDKAVKYVSKEISSGPAIYISNNILDEYVVKPQEVGIKENDSVRTVYNAPEGYELILDKELNVIAYPEDMIVRKIVKLK